MSCEHEVRFTIKPTDDACRFHFDVRAYKDRIVAPDEYSGATEVTPSDSEQVIPTKDKLVRDDITVNPAPTETLSTTSNGTFTPSDGKVGFSAVSVDVNPDLRPLTVDSLTQHGTFLPTGDGFSQVTVEEDWDGILYPITDETDPIYDSKPFDAHWVQLNTGDTIIIEGYGRGRWVGFRGITTVNISSLPATINITVRSAPQFDYLRFRFDAVEDCIAVLASSNGSREGTHSGQVGYCFCGDYLRWKVIHAS